MHNLWSKLFSKFCQSPGSFDTNAFIHSSKAANQGVKSGLVTQLAQCPGGSSPNFRVLVVVH